MEAKDFYEIAVEPEFGDEMVFQIRVPEERQKPNRTFSFEALDAIGEQIRNFVMARVAARWKQTGKGPHHVTAHVKVTWGGKTERMLEQGGPWWSLDDEGLTLIDGEYREKARE